MTVATDPAPEPVRQAGVGIEHTEQAVVLTLSGELEFSSIDPINTTVFGVLAERPAVVVLDLLAVTFLGEAGLALVVEATQRAGPHTSLRVIAGPAILRKLQVTGLDGYLSAYPTRRDAFAALETPLPPRDSEQ